MLPQLVFVIGNLSCSFFFFFLQCSRFSGCCIVVPPSTGNLCTASMDVTSWKEYPPPLTLLSFFFSTAFPIFMLLWSTYWSSSHSPRKKKKKLRSSGNFSNTIYRDLLSHISVSLSNYIVTGINSVFCYLS